MKFRRNVKEEKLFHAVALFSLIVTIILTAVYLLNHNENILQFIGLLVLIFLLYFYIVHSLRKNYVEFQDDKIILINGNSRNIVINICEIETILFPSAKALQNKLNENAIIIKRAAVKNIINYNPQIERYIKDNYKIDTIYYDNYKKAIQ